MRLRHALSRDAGAFRINVMKASAAVGCRRSLTGVIDERECSRRGGDRNKSPLRLMRKSQARSYLGMTRSNRQPNGFYRV